jgi:hypothetical protein
MCSILVSPKIIFIIQYYIICIDFSTSKTYNLINIKILYKKLKYGEKNEKGELTHTGFGT